MLFLAFEKGLKGQNHSPLPSGSCHLIKNSEGNFLIPPRKWKGIPPPQYGKSCLGPCVNLADSGPWYIQNLRNIQYTVIFRT